MLCYPRLRFWLTPRRGGHGLPRDAAATALLVDVLEDGGGGGGIAEGAVVAFEGDAEVFAEIREAVGGESGEKFPGCDDGAEGGSAEFAVESGEFLADERVVELCVVRYEYGVSEKLTEGTGDFSRRVVRWQPSRR